MTEQEYIDATNLAKVRAALSILRDVLPSTKMEKSRLRRASAPLAVMAACLANAIRVMEAEDTSNTTKGARAQQQEKQV